jgi:RNA-directed DNA polymerase
MEQRNSYRDDKGKAQPEGQSGRPNTNDLREGRLSRSSDESPVMGVERRAEVIQLKLPLSPLDNRGRNRTMETKSIPVTQEMVIAAYKRVKKNKGAAGIDDETLEVFEKNISDNLYVIWNRLCSGSYHPSSVLEVEIPKDDGKMRKLGIPIVRDRIAQQVIKDYLEDRFEAIFSENSYGYRPMRNTHQAIAQVRRNVREYQWVIDMDISSFFDKMSHELLMKAVDKHVEEKWVKMYLIRWLEAPIENRNGNKRIRMGEGTPQGGVISPLLANLFLHYSFDKWLGKIYPKLRFVRYADDIIVHCSRQAEAEEVLKAIRERMVECRLELNEKKTKIVHCKKARRNAEYKTVQFDFLGFSFQPRPTMNKEEGKMFLGFDCAISDKKEKKIIDEIRKTNFQRWTNRDIYHIAEFFNPKFSGWINYYGKYRKYELQWIFDVFHRRLNKWVVNRYKRLKGSRKQAARWLRDLALRQPDLFVHWLHGFKCRVAFV